MPKKGSKVPSYCRHKASGRAVVRIDGVDVYLGPYGSEESHGRYQAAITEWRNRSDPTVSTSGAVVPTQRPFILTINDLLARYAVFAAGYYCHEGKPTKELRCMQDALRPMRRLYGDLPATEFGPLKLKAVRQAMIERDWCRQLVNRHVNRIKRFFKWAVSEELIPSSVFESVRTVDGLHAGRSNVREAPPVVPVAPEVIDATIPFMSPQVAAMVCLQRLTGMRPGEAVQMRPCDLNRSDEVWIYEPLQHKTRWRGHRKQILLGPKTQTIIQPFLSRATHEHLFQPIEAEAWRSEERRKTRKSPLTPSQSARKPSAGRPRAAKSHYTEDAYRRAVDYAIKKANRNGVEVPHWFPNQIRHTYGTEVRKKFGIEAAQVALGHARCDVTEVYAERNMDQAREIARTEG